MKNEELILDLVKELKTDLRDFKIEVFKRFEQTDKRLDRLEHNFQRLEDHQEEDRKMLFEVWKSRENVVARFTWDFIWKAAGANFVILLLMYVILDKIWT